MTPEELTERLKTDCGANLASVVLYGSAAAGDRAAKGSDFNVIVVLKRAAAADLRAAAETARRWAKAGNPPPVFFDEAHVAASADAFPLEFADVRDARLVLHGADPFADARVDPAHLRVALERELKSALLRLRGRYALAAGRPKELAALVAGSLSTFLSLSRGALRLFEPGAPARKIEAAERLAAHAPFDPGTFRDALAVKEGRFPGDVEALFEKYLAAVEAVCAAVDRHAGK